jgi:hypothetical protein
VVLVVLDQEVSKEILEEEEHKETRDLLDLKELKEPLVIKEILDIEDHKVDLVTQHTVLEDQLVIKELLVYLQY